MTKRTIPTTREFVGREAEEYDRQAGLKKQQIKVASFALDLLNLPKGSKILDIGCGTGWTMEVVKERGYDVFGVDNSADMLVIASKKGFAVELMDMKELKFEDISFDGVISISALNFIAEGCRSIGEVRHNYVTVAKEIYRVLREGGRAVLEYYPQSEEEERLSVREFARAGFAGELIRNIYAKKRGERFLNITKTTAPQRGLLIKEVSLRL